MHSLHTSSARTNILCIHFQSEHCHQLCNNLAKDHVALAAEAMFVKAVQLGKEGKAKEAAKLLTEHAIGDKELPVKLASVQLLLSQDQKREAIAILENLNERDRSLPGIVSALVTLYMADNDREGASAALKNAVAYYKRNKVRVHSRARDSPISLGSRVKKDFLSGNDGKFGRIVATSRQLLLTRRRNQGRG
jgi:predicted Zn-dependent protease